MLEWLLDLLRRLLAVTSFLRGAALMARYTKQVQADGTWRIYDAQTGEPVGRIWLGAHVDRILRDSNLAEAIAAILNQTGATRRQSARTFFNDWLTAGGHSVNFSALTQSMNNDAGQADTNRHFYIAGNELGYLHGEVQLVHGARLARFVRLAEECFSGEQLGTTALRNAALDTALDRFRDDGALT